MSISRTLLVDDLTPAELAILFTDLDDFRQAEFFSEIWKIAKDWNGAGWCQQSCSIIQRLDADGRSAVAALSEHLALETASEIASLAPQGDVQ